MGFYHSILVKLIFHHLNLGLFIYSLCVRARYNKDYTNWACRTLYTNWKILLVLLEKINVIVKIQYLLHEWCNCHIDMRQSHPLISASMKPITYMN